MSDVSIRGLSQVSKAALSVPAFAGTGDAKKELFWSTRWSVAEYYLWTEMVHEISSLLGVPQSTLRLEVWKGLCHCFEDWPITLLQWLSLGLMDAGRTLPPTLKFNGGGAKVLGLFYRLWCGLLISSGDESSPYQNIFANSTLLNLWQQFREDLFLFQHYCAPANFNDLAQTEPWPQLRRAQLECTAAETRPSGPTFTPDLINALVNDWA